MQLLFQTQFSSSKVEFWLETASKGMVSRISDFHCDVRRLPQQTNYSNFFKRLNGNIVFLPFLRRNPRLRRTKRSGSGWSLPTSLCWSGALHLRALDCLVFSCFLPRFIVSILGLNCELPHQPETFLLLTNFHSIIWPLRRLPSYLSIQDVPPDVLEEEGWGGSDCPPGSIAVSCQHHLMGIEIQLQRTVNPIPLKK